MLIKPKGHTHPEPKLVVFRTCLCIPGRPRSRARFRAKARLLWGTLREKTNKHEKTAAKFNTKKQRRRFTLEGLIGSDLLVGLRDHYFKQLKEDLLDITEKIKSKIKGGFWSNPFFRLFLPGLFLPHLAKISLKQQNGSIRSL